MKYPKYVLSIVIVSIGAMLGVIFQNELFVAYLWTLAGLALFLPLTSILGVFAVVFGASKRRIGKGPSRIGRSLNYSLVVSCSCVVSLVVFETTGDLINRWKVGAVESYVAHAVPVLDQIKQKEGSYPSTLPVDLLGEPPGLLQNYGDYTATGSTFRFEYVDEPAGWAGGEGAIEFDSEVRKWTDDR
jgi:hypothetical protein